MKILRVPEEAKAEFLTAFEKVKGRRSALLKALNCSSYSLFYSWVEALGIDLAKLDKAGTAMGWPVRRSGGAGFHKDPDLRAKRAKRTMKKFGIRPGRKKASASTA
jgi:hypothetical protein